MEDKYKETKAILSSMANVKMMMNDHKGSIEELHSGDIIKMLKDEIDELVEAIDKAYKTGDYICVIEEGADALNFLVAIVHQQIIKYRSRKNEHK